MKLQSKVILSNEDIKQALFQYLSQNLKGYNLNEKEVMESLEDYGEISIDLDITTEPVKTPRKPRKYTKRTKQEPEPVVYEPESEDEVEEEEDSDDEYNTAVAKDKPTVIENVDDDEFDNEKPIFL